MRKYRYSYHTVVSYDSMVTQHHFQLRTTPRQDSHQKVVANVVDHLTQMSIRVDEDCFGNPIQYGLMPYPHDLFVAASQGVVECESYRVCEPKPTPLFVAATKMTQMSPQLTEFSRSIDMVSGGAVDRAQRVAQAIYSYMIYEGGATTIETTAAQCFDMGRGVCQDFAHILIAICRNYAIFARYCVGFLVGTGETHAWVEVYSEEDGAWYGIDPTHNRVIEYDYIKIAHGRDASDCSVIRGVHMGAAAHTTQVRVVVEPL